MQTNGVHTRKWVQQNVKSILVNICRKGIKQIKIIPVSLDRVYWSQQRYLKQVNMLDNHLL